MRRLLHNRKFAVGMIISLLFLLVALLGPWFVTTVLQVDPRGIDYDAISAPPSAQHLLGTNHVGQDVLAQLIIGARGSVTVGLLSGIIATVIAVLVGTTAGYLGGVPDKAINAVVNVLMTLPGFALLFIIAGYVQEAGILLIAVVIGLLEWPGGARSIRAQTMSLRNRDFTSALRTVGESTPASSRSKWCRTWAASSPPCSSRPWSPASSWRPPWHSWAWAPPARSPGERWSARHRPAARSCAATGGSSSRPAWPSP